MKPHRALRLAVISYIILFAISVALAFAEQENLPLILREWSDAQAIPLFSLSIGILGLLGTLIGCAAMLASQRWGAWFHLISTALGGLAAAGMGPQVISAAMSTIDGLVMIISGLVYGLAFFTDALPRSTKRPNKAPEPTPPSVTPRACARVAPAGVVAHL